MKKMLVDIKGGLMAAEVLAKLGKFPTVDIDVETAKELLKSAMEMVNEHKISYALIAARKAENNESKV